MAGYIRQSVANIINGSKITAPPLNAEFNKIQDAFNGISGHTHDGSTGNGQKIPLPTSVVGYLPVDNGGVGGKNNTTATADPTTADDGTQGYAPGSVWINATTGYAHICLHNNQNAANWVPLLAVASTNEIAPKTTNTVDIGTDIFQFKDIHIDGVGYIDEIYSEELNTTGDVDVGGDITVSGTITGNSTLATSNVDIDGGSIDGTAIGAGTASTGAFAGLTATGNVTFASATIANLGTVTSADIDGGSIDAVTLGTNSAVTEAQIDNINIDGNAITSTDTNGNISITPDGTGTVDITKANVTGGNIDGTSIGATTASTGSFTDLSVSGTISGDMTGALTGDIVGDVYAGDTTSKVLESGTDGTNASFTGSVTGNLSGNVSSTGSSTFHTLNIDSALTFNAGATATISNLVTPTNSGDAANKGYVDTAVSNLLDSAPGTLDTLNELAAALGDDASFSTNVTASIATKLPLAGGAMTGNINMTDATNAQHSIVGLADPTNNQDAATKAYADTKLPLVGGTVSGTLTMGSTIAMGANKITGAADPTDAQDAATKAYVDLQTNGLSQNSASDSATAAALSEANALSYANSASSTAGTVANLYDSFTDKYLGAKATAPSVDDDGDALVNGTLYFDTVTQTMKVYSATNGWIEAGSSVNGILDKFKFVTGSGSQTTFSGSDANGNTLAYDVNYVDVYLSGLRLVNGTDYTATTGTSIQLTTAPDVSTILEIVAFGNFAINNPATISPNTINMMGISAEDSVSGAVEQVFVYDTRKDSDGGAWRKRTGHTSWYEEKGEFPAVAVIVARETASVSLSVVEILDGTDPTLPVWMSFNVTDAFPSGTSTNHGHLCMNLSSGYFFSACKMLDGILYLSDFDGPVSSQFSSGSGYFMIDFVKDQSSGRFNSSANAHILKNFKHTRNIKNRNDTGVGSGYYVESASEVGENGVLGMDVAVLPNAPIDETRGLPKHTIATATRKDLIVRKDDGTICRVTTSSTTLSNTSGYDKIFDVQIVEDKYIDFTFSTNQSGTTTYPYRINIPSSDVTVPASARLISTTDPDYLPGASYIIATLAHSDAETVHYGHGQGLTTLHLEDNQFMTQIDNSSTSGLVPKYTEVSTLGSSRTGTASTSNYIVGGGDFTDFTSYGSELVSNGDFSNGTTGWTLDGFTVSNGKLVKVAGTGNAKEAATSCNLIAGKTYVATFDYADTGTNLQFSIGTATSLRTQSFTITEGTGAKSIIFTPDTNMSYVGIIGHDSYAGEVDNISVKEATENLVANGDFSDGTTDWTAETGWSISGGAATVVAQAGSLPTDLSQTLSLTENKLYKVEYTITGAGADPDGLISIGDSVNDTHITANGTYTHYFIATASSDRIEFRVTGSGDGGDTYTVSNISLKELQGWSFVGDDASTAAIINGKLRLTRNAGTSFKATQEITLPDNDMRLIKWTVGDNTTASSNSAIVRLGTTSGMSDALNEWFGNDNPGDKISRAITRSGTLYLEFSLQYNGTYMEIGDLVFVDSEKQTYGLGGHLEYSGTIEREPVETGAELVKYRGIIPAT